MIRQGLKDFSVSRARVKWGIPVPEEPDHVFYVWMDALVELHHRARLRGRRARRTASSGSGADERLHLVGKEIIRFHCLYWPAMLHAAGVPVPTRVFAHGWLTQGRQEAQQDHGQRHRPRRARRPATAPTRCATSCCARASFGQDWDFTDEAFVTRYNSDLANDLGNLVSRALTMVARYCDGKVPPRPLRRTDDGLEARFQSEKVDWDATGTR